jgi:hypothetical protein
MIVKVHREGRKGGSASVVGCTRPPLVNWESWEHSDLRASHRLLVTRRLGSGADRALTAMFSVSQQDYWPENMKLSDLWRSREWDREEDVLLLQSCDS